MNDSFEEPASRNYASAYMNLSNSEKGELIFKDVKNSYTFWSIKKAIKEEIVKGKSKPSEISENIPRLMKELNLETKVKNKVHELLDKNGYFKEASKVTITKFKNCKNSTQLPEHFFD
jgi:transcription initiation factor TFIIIB Brf1 subunit/transcription initiation factor TFIIB